MSYNPSTIFATNPQGAVVNIPISGTSFLTTTPLTANASINSGWIDTSGYATAYVIFFSDQLSATNGIRLETSNDGVNVLDTALATYLNVNDARRSAFTPSARYFRYTYTNGATNQTLFEFSINLYATVVSPSMQSLSSVVNSTSFAAVEKSVLELPDNTGVYDKIQRTGNAINVTSALPSGAATSALQISGNSSLSSLDTKLPAKGQATMANSTPIAIASDQSSIPVRNHTSSTSTVTRVNVLTASTQLLAANSSRKGFSICAEGIVYVLFGTGSASATNYSIKLTNNGYYETPPGITYTGVISASASTVVVQVSEYT